MNGLAVTVTLDQKTLRDAEQRLVGVRNGLRKAIAGAANETAKEAKTVLSRRVRDRVNIKKRDIDKHIRIHWASYSSKKANEAAKVSLLEAERIPLKAFGARQSRSGVSYQIAKSGGRKKIGDAFGPKIDRLGKHVYRRATRKRLPLVGPLKGPSAWGVAVKTGVDRELLIEMQPTFEKNLEQRVKALVKGYIK